MARKTENEKFLNNERRDSSSNSTNCYSKWWNQDFQHQKTIVRISESNHFRIVVIFLVVIDTILIIGELMLDSFKVHYECKTSHKVSKEEQHLMKHRIELATEIAHFTSIGILLFFTIELIVKIYACGKEFWNIRKKKMEYFDAFIVITSLIIDIYFLQGEKKIIGEELILLFAFRLWRFVRIVNSVAEGIHHGQSKHKQYLIKQYLTAVHRLNEILKHKTNHFENNSENFNLILEHFQMIDNRCQASLDEINHNHELTASGIIEQFLKDLNGLENENKDSTVSAMFIKGSEV